MADTKFGGQFYKAHVRGANGHVEEQGVWNLDTPFVNESDNQDVLNYISASLNYLHDRMQTGNVNDRLQAISAELATKTSELNAKVTNLTTELQKVKKLADSNKLGLTGISDVENKIQLLSSTVSRASNDALEAKSQMQILKSTIDQKISTEISALENSLENSYDSRIERLETWLSELERRIAR